MGQLERFPGNPRGRKRFPLEKHLVQGKQQKNQMEHFPETAHGRTSVPLQEGRPTQANGRAGPSPSPPSLRSPHLARPRRPHGGDRESQARLLTSVVVITLISLELFVHK